MVSVTLPRDLQEEILSRVPSLSLTRFRAVCKQWNSLFDSNKFVEYHLVQSRPQFIFQIESNIHSVAVNFSDLRIEVSELTLEIPYHEDHFYLNRITPSLKILKLIDYVNCDGLLFCSSKIENGLLIWNPWLRQSRILPTEDISRCIYYIGYDDKKRYKFCEFWDTETKIYEIGLVSSKRLNLTVIPMSGSTSIWSDIRSNLLSLSGTLYWADVDLKNDIFIRNFSFSTETLTTFCRLPYKYDDDNVLSLSVFRTDRLSLLDVCNKSSTITVWLTKNKINTKDPELEDDVVWIKLTTVIIPNFPKFSLHWCNRPDLTHFVDNEDVKRLVICCYDRNDHHGYVYIVRGVMFKKIKIDHYNAPYDYHDPNYSLHFPKLLTYVPSLVRPSWVNEDNKT